MSTAGGEPRKQQEARFDRKNSRFSVLRSGNEAPFDVHTDIRAVVSNENFVAEITPYLKVIAETLKDSRERSEQQQDRAKKYADQRRRSTPTFNIGDEVLVDVHALNSQERNFSSKFVPRRDGPYIVIETKSPVTYMGKYHVSALRAFAHDDGDGNVQPVVPLRRRCRPKKAPAPEVVPDAEEDAVEPDVTQVQPSGQRPRKRPTCTCCAYSHIYFLAQLSSFQI